MAQTMQHSTSTGTSATRAVMMLERLYKSYVDGARREALQSLGLGAIANEMSGNMRVQARLDAQILHDPVEKIPAHYPSFPGADGLILIFETGLSEAALDLGLSWHADAVAEALVSGHDGPHRNIPIGRMRVILGQRVSAAYATETSLPDRDHAVVQGVLCLSCWARGLPKPIAQATLALLQDVLPDGAKLPTNTADTKLRLGLVDRWICMTLEQRAKQP